VATTVRVHGIREVTAAFRKIDGELAKRFGSDLKKAAEPVAEESRRTVTRYRGASVGTIRAKQSGARVFVEQSARKVTGHRGDFGALQLRNVLEPALEDQSDHVFAEVERILDKYSSAAGF
jgi:hypothetical protein